MAHYPQSFVAKYGLSVSAAEDSVTNATYYPLFGTQSVGVLAIKASSTKLSFNPFAGLLSATAFAGNGSQITNIDIGNVSSGVLAITRGGTGTNLATGTGNNVLANGAVMNLTTINSPTIANPSISNPTVSGTANFDGTVNVATTLEIGSTTAVSYPYVDFHSNGPGDFDARISASGGNATSGNGSLTYQANGGHYFNGAIVGNGDITAFSDIRFKEEIKPIVGALARVRSWQGVRYKVKATGEIRKGFVAQWIYMNDGEEYVLRDKETGFLSLMYQNMAADHNEAIKEVDDKLESVTEALTKAMTTIASLESRIKGLEGR